MCVGLRSQHRFLLRCSQKNADLEGYAGAAGGAPREGRGAFPAEVRMAAWEQRHLHGGREAHDAEGERRRGRQWCRRGERLRRS